MEQKLKKKEKTTTRTTTNLAKEKAIMKEKNDHPQQTKTFNKSAKMNCLDIPFFLLLPSSSRTWHEELDYEPTSRYKSRTEYTQVPKLNYIVHQLFIVISLSLVLQAHNANSPNHSRRK